MVTSLGIGHLKKQFLQVLDSLWRRKYSLLILLFVLLKLIRVKMDKLSYQAIDKVIVTHDPLSLYDPNKGTFKTINRTEYACSVPSCITKPSKTRFSIRRCMNR